MKVCKLSSLQHVDQISGELDRWCKPRAEATMSLSLQRSMLKMLGNCLIQMLVPGGSVANQLQPGPG